MKRPASAAPKFNVQAILRALQESSPLVADQYLEFLVLNRNSDVRRTVHVHYSEH